MVRSTAPLCSILILLLPIISSSSLPRATITTFSQPDTRLQHIAYSNGTGHLYVGATNHIYKLDSELNILDNVTTGPVLDSQLCDAKPAENSTTCTPVEGITIPKVLTNNYNKILAIDASRGKIVTCGSVYQGSCHIRSLYNLIDGEFYTGGSRYVAANDETTSTVGFVGPGPDNDDALYVGTGVVDNVDGDIGYLYTVRYNVPAVSSRKLTDMIKPLGYFSDFVGVSRAQFVGTRSSASDLQIKYKSGFYADGNSYFFTNQLHPEDNGIMSKIIRVCKDDKNFSSYVETEIICQHAQENYTIVEAATVTTVGADLADYLGTAEDSSVIVAVFSRAATTLPSVRHSAVCLYKLDDVRTKLYDNVLACHREDTTLPTKYVGSEACGRTGFQVPDPYCGPPEDANKGPVIGRFPLVGVAQGIYTNEHLISVTTSLYDRLTLAYFGTSEGLVKKVVLADGGLTLAEDIEVESGSSILPDMALTNDQTHLLVMTENTVNKIPLWDCSRFTDCSSCLAHLDPHCGWCALENSCTAVGDCQNSQASLRWLADRTRPDSCIEVTDISPRNMSVNTPQQISVRVQQLPPLSGGESYSCVFNDITQTSVQGSVTGSVITCSSADVQAPVIPPGLDFASIRVSLQSSETGINFLSTDLPYYDCDRHTSCSSCAGAAWQCQWCVHSDSCVDQFSSCSLSASDTIGYADMCPRLLESSVLLSADFTTNITLSAENLPVPLAGQSGYKCLVFLSPTPVGETLVQVDADRLSDNTLRCQDTTYDYPGMDETIAASISVVWNGDFSVESFTTMTLYRCGRMADDCSTCKSVDLRYECQWCRTSCQYREMCTSADGPCPPPSITSVTPLTGALEGGTRITINGGNLGQNFASINGAVTIGSTECVAVEDLYQTSKRIVCVTQRVAEEESLHIEIRLNSHMVAYRLNFTYQDPDPQSFTPSYGPISGGTLLTIAGQKLMTGSVIEVSMLSMETVNSTVACSFIMWSGESLVCRTPNVSRPEPYMVQLSFDGTVKNIANNDDYVYRPDPNVTNIYPLQSYPSGGRKVTVEGHFLDTVQKPALFLWNGATEIGKTACQNVNSSYLMCVYPNLTLTDLRVRRQIDLRQYPLGLEMDGVHAVRNLDKEVTLVPDPYYDQFPDGPREYRGEALILTGSNLNLACTTQEVVVRIGEELCNVTLLDSEELVCEPPMEQPAASQGPYPQVTVQVGNLVFNLGTLRYQTKSTGMPDDNKLLYIVIPSVLGGFLITVIIIILIVYKRKSMEAERQYKMIQAQLDTLESNVRNECKLAFAELQTEVSDFTSDLNVIGIPFWDYKSYTFKVLFPGHNDHTILHRTPSTYVNQYGGYEEGIHQFNQLLNSKHFLLIFIRTLEAQKNFGIRDKAVVASLLMVILQDKMEYATEILKALLNELVDRSVEKKHPKLMLRRTESVVEKLVTNWLSLCMYSYLKKHAGKTLFMLYKAIKHQAEKGPVDGITSEARYSLSEDRLLREKIEAKSLTIMLLSDNDDGREPVTCRVLDCDTITQAKEKALDAIYMNTPHARRPSVHDVDLVWRSGQSGHLPLRDEDVTTKTEHGWKRVNTLAHYHVKDHAMMSLVPVKDKNELVHNVHGMVEVTSGTSLSAISPIIMVEEGTKVWHLVKHDDNQQGNHRGQKVISEIFLTRLLATKGTLQQYVDDLFGTILRADNTLPPAIKYLFDFLDSAARRHNILDSDVVYTWKSNSLPLRFWVNIIKNPEFVFDVSKSHIVDSCLSVIAQTFMDSCSTTEHRLGKDSPSNKLLFAKDIPRYRQWVSRFYKNVQDMPAVSDQEMTRVMTELSMTNITDFNVAVALKELYKYSMQYSFELAEALDEDPSARKMHLAKRFDQVTATIEGAQYY